MLPTLDQLEGILEPTLPPLVKEVCPTQPSLLKEFLACSTLPSLTSLVLTEINIIPQANQAEQPQPQHHLYTLPFL